MASVAAMENVPESKIDINDVFSLRRPKDFKAGLSSGLKSYAKGIFGGLVGLVAAPVVGCQREGATGLAKGVLHGFVGVIVLPVAGISIGTAQMVRGLYNTPEAIRESSRGNVWDEDNRVWVDGMALALREEHQTKKKQTRGGAPSADDIDYYAILQVPRDATSQEIRKQYYILARKYHPDKNPGDEAAHKKFQQLGEAYQVLGTPELRTKYDQHGSSALDVNFMDGGEFFNALFGGDAFDHLIGELILASAARSGGELAQSEMKRMQAIRIDELVVNLNNITAQYEAGEIEEFMASQKKEAERLVQAPFGEVILHTIGKVYVMQSDLYTGGFFDVTMARFRQQGEALKSQLNAANAAIKVYQAQQRIEEWQKKKDKEAAKDREAALVAGAPVNGTAGETAEASTSADAAKDPAAENTEGGVSTPEPKPSTSSASSVPPPAKNYDDLIERAKLEADALPLMLEAMWAANVLDIQDTLKAVVKKYMAGIHDKEVQKKRAMALKELGNIYLAATPPEPSLDTKDARTRMEEAMMRAMNKAAEAEPAEKEAAPTSSS